MDAGLTEALIERGRKAGADIVGVADAEEIRRMAPQYDTRRFLDGAKHVVIALVADPIGITKVTDKKEYTAIAFPSYKKADGAAYSMKTFLKDEGYKTREIVREWHRARDKKGRNVKTISLKHSAVAAGLGEVGRHTLLITPEYGPRVRMSGFVTDAPLESGKPYVDSLCDDCGICAKACPSGAIGAGAADFDFMTCSAYLFAGISKKELKESARGDLSVLRKNAERLGESFTGWMEAFVSGNKLYYNCGKCLIKCSARKRFAESSK